MIYEGKTTAYQSHAGGPHGDVLEEGLADKLNLEVPETLEGV